MCPPTDRRNMYWKCPVCNYEASDEAEKQAHMQEATDQAHRELLKEKAKNVGLKIENKAKDVVGDIKGGIDKLAENLR
jgi:hypothetical protein